MYSGEGMGIGYCIIETQIWTIFVTVTHSDSIKIKYFQYSA